jgi:NADH dehydrogenase (ubiquinone) Fe-S protein 4
MLYFEREEDAVAFAQREGFQYTILPFHAKKIKAKAFADNFKWRGPPKEEQKKE